MATRTKTKWISPPNEIVIAFEAGVWFGRKMELRYPRRFPLWSDDEWQKALTKALKPPLRVSAVHKR